MAKQGYATHASTGKIKATAPGGRTRSSGLAAKSRPKVQTHKLRASGQTRLGTRRGPGSNV